MNERYPSEHLESPRATEERAVIRESREAQRWLRTEVENSAENRQYKRHFRGLNFHYNTTNILENWGNIIKRLNEKFKDDDSLEWVLFNNPQVKKLLSNIVSAQAKDIRHERRIHEKLSARKKAEDDKASQDNENTIENEGLDWNEIEEEPVESWEDYKYNQSSLWNFEDFILSDEWIAVIVNELKRHIDEKTGEFYPNYPISEDILKLRLKNAWDNKLHRDYNIKNGDPTSDEDKDKFDRLWNIFEDEIDNIVWEYIKSWWNKFDKSLMDSIEYVLVEKWNQESLNKNNDVFKEILRWKIKNFSSIVLKNDRFSLNTWDKQIDLQLRSYLFMYGKIFHPNAFKANQSEQYYEGLFPKIMWAILSADGYDELEKYIKNNEFLEQEKRAEEARRKRDEQKRREIAKRNRERNNNYAHSWWKWQENPDSSSTWKKWDLQEASWAEIAQRSNLNLWDFEVNTGMAESIAQNDFAKNMAFWAAWKKFINSHSEIAEILTDRDMRRLYDMEKKSINESEWEEFLKSDIMKWKSQDEINNIRRTLSDFTNDFDSTLKQLASQASVMEWRTNDKIRNYAIWSVIDNVRFIFADIVEKWKSDSKFEWFRFDWSEPVKREWNDIIISWTFNWSDIKIRYDLLSWGLYMNSFLHHLSPSKVTIWKNNNADLQIWQLESFDTILDRHYHAPDISSSKHPHIQDRWTQDSWTQDLSNQEPWWNPWSNEEKNNMGKLYYLAQNHIENHTTNEQLPPQEPISNIPTHNPSNPWSFRPITSEIRGNSREEMESIRKKYKDMLNINLDMISNSIINHTKRQSAVNSIITKFMTTFNIMSPSWWFGSLDFNEWSNLFDLIQIIERTSDPNDGNIQNLEYFSSTFMPVAMEYSWLKWWERNELQNKNGQKSKDIFGYNGDNKYINWLKDKTKDFNPKQFSWVANFEKQHQLWFADLIKENIITWNKPNWKLDGEKMRKFVNGLEWKQVA